MERRRPFLPKVSAYLHPFALIALVCGLVAIAAAQTSTTGKIVGTVTDPSGAVVPKAEVMLQNLATNATSTVTTNEAGNFTFPSVTPGPYKLTVSSPGFQTANIVNLSVDVNKSLTVPVTLQVGGKEQIVEVREGARVELQTTDAQIGNAINTEAIQKLPTLQRNVTELMSLQPGVTPVANGLRLRATGAIEDQNTVTLDGIDITENIISSGTTVPTPSDSVEQFRIGVANPNANYDRASGGQMALVGRHGSNTWHGAGYWYHQNDNLNANTWDNNYNKIKKPELKDNRFGGRLGGPIFRDKTFFFTNYEGRRFPQVFQVTRTVPTDTLKQGILRFRDQSGNVINYDLATAALCGSAGNQPCDPRGLGISPSVRALWALMPAGNFTGGDGLNTTGFLANIGVPLQDDYSVLRLDHSFAEHLKFNGSYTYFRHLAFGTGQVDIRNGNAKSATHVPQRGDLISAGLTWDIHPTLLNVFRWGWVRNRDATQATVPSTSAGLLNIPGTQTSAGPIAIVPGSGTFIDAPIDMDTQRARYQADWDKQIQFIDDVTWVRGNHTAQLGGNINFLPYKHVRGDKVVGSVTSLVAALDASTFLTIPAANRPPTCSTSVVTNCIRSTDATNWGRYYASVLGLLDNVSILAMRDANLNPLPFGTNLENITKQWAYYFYGQDSWRMSPSLTVTLGLSYGWQTAPTEEQGRQTVMIDAGTGKEITAKDYLNSKQQAALAGQVFNPTIGFLPVGQAHRPVYNTDYGDIAPRASFAWNPSFDKSLLGLIFGQRRLVVRGGFGIIYDRSNTVQSVEIPMLGVGFDQNINVKTPLCNVSGAPGAGCNPGVSNNPGASVYRVGVDGTIPLPVLSPITAPVIPASPFSETLSFQVDPDTKVGRSYNVDLGIQRELPGGFVFEAAYAGRFARHLPQAVNLSQSPYMFVDAASKQTFAQAYDAVATALRAGTKPEAVAVQPWFENQLPGVAALISTATSPCSTATTCLAASQSSNFTNAQVSQLFQNIGTFRRQLGLLPYNNDQAVTEFMRTYIGSSNYNGLLMSVRKRLALGLTMDANYTLSKTLDESIQWQNNAGYYTNSFHPGVDYGPSLFDRRHVFNADYVYDLPLGRGHRLAGPGWLNRIIGGWYTSGIFTVQSGLPLIVTDSSQVWGGGTILGGNTAAIPIGPLPETGRFTGIVGSNGIGTNANPNGTQHGTGMDLFADPAAAFADFRHVLLSQDTRSGRGQALRGLPWWNMDVAIGKSTPITERVAFRYSFDFFNVFNHPNFNNPPTGNPNNLSLQNQAGFGVLAPAGATPVQLVPPNRTNGARWIEFGARIEF